MRFSKDVKCPECKTDSLINFYFVPGSKDYSVEHHCPCGSMVLVRAYRSGRVQIVDCIPSVEFEEENG